MRLKGKWYCCVVLAVYTAAAGFVSAQSGTLSSSANNNLNLLEHKTNGLSFTFPANWRTQVVGDVFVMMTPETSDQICFKISPMGKLDIPTFFALYRKIAPDALGFVPNLGSTEPTIYGAWRGVSINGQGSLQGAPYVASVTAIPANDQIYLFQMAAPAARQWEAFLYRKTLANSLNFAKLPAESRGETGPCRNCLAIWSDAMQRITAATVKGMR